MIAYRDFHLKAARPSFFGHGGDETSVTFDDAVELANAWIAAEDIRVINLETITLPEGGGSWLRVWHETS